MPSTHSGGEPTALPATANKLLAALPASLRAQLEGECERVSLRQGQLLYEAGQPVIHVYFPLVGVGSLLTVLEDGSAVEAAMVGNDGLVGLPIFLSGEADVNRALVQVDGAALRMSAGAARAAVAREPALAEIVRRWTQTLLAHMAQSAACGRTHPIDERLARWLLQVHDRMSADQFGLTQDFLAMMLGVRRASVTTAAGMLQQAGLIRYHRGRITILDRPLLEDASCECYRAITGATARLVGNLSL